MTIRLVALTDLERFPEPAPALARLCGLARPRSVALVLRDKAAPLRQRLALGRELRDLTLQTDQLLFVADRVDLALELEADGVHLPRDGLDPSQVSALLSDALISRAHHGASELGSEELRRCAFVLVSPAFAERKGRGALGALGLAARFAELRSLAPEVALMALGGVNSLTAAAALAAGADGIAAIGAAHESSEQDALIQLMCCAR